MKKELLSWLIFIIGVWLPNVQASDMRCATLGVTLKSVSQQITETGSSSKERCISGENSSVRIENVSYEYVMTSSDSDGTTKYYCNGPILFDVLVPNTTKILVVRRTRNHFVRDDGRIFWGIMSKYDIESSTVKSISFPGVSWGMYIEASAYDDNGKWLCSDTICTNDYINSEDLRLLTATSSITETKISEPKVYLSESNIIVETDQLTDLWIYDTCGICLMHQNISSRIAIPVDSYGHKLLIVRTTTENGVRTTKLNL